MPSLEALDRLAKLGLVHVVGVATQPDRPGSRGIVREPAIKEAARALGLTLFQPERLAGKELTTLLSLRPDTIIQSFMRPPAGNAAEADADAADEAT